MGMSNWILDVEEKFWDHAHKIIGDCESHKEFKELMFKFDTRFFVILPIPLIFPGSQNEMSIPILIF